MDVFHVFYITCIVGKISFGEVLSQVVVALDKTSAAFAEQREVRELARSVGPECSFLQLCCHDRILLLMVHWVPRFFVLFFLFVFFKAEGQVIIKQSQHLGVLLPALPSQAV